MYDDRHRLPRDRYVMAWERQISRSTLLCFGTMWSKERGLGMIPSRSAIMRDALDHRSKRLLRDAVRRIEGLTSNLSRRAKSSASRKLTNRHEAQGRRNWALPRSYRRSRHMRLAISRISARSMPI